MKKAFLIVAASVTLTGAAYADGPHGGHGGGGVQIGGVTGFASGISSGVATVNPNGGSFVSPSFGVIDVHAHDISIGNGGGHDGGHGGGMGGGMPPSP
jgi:hypothetical protein